MPKQAMPTRKYEPPKDRKMTQLELIDNFINNVLQYCKKENDPHITHSILRDIGHDNIVCTVKIDQPLLDNCIIKYESLLNRTDCPLRNWNITVCVNASHTPNHFHVFFQFRNRHIDKPDISAFIQFVVQELPPDGIKEVINYLKVLLNPPKDKNEFMNFMLFDRVDNFTCDDVITLVKRNHTNEDDNPCCLGYQEESTLSWTLNNIKDVELRVNGNIYHLTGVENVGPCQHTIKLVFITGTTHFAGWDIPNNK